jgi:hypothetical protein
MTDDIISTDLSKKDRANLLVALKTLAALESGKPPLDFSRDRLNELHELRDRLLALS